MRERVRPPLEYETLLNELADPDKGVFKTRQKALMFSAAVGFAKQRGEATDDFDRGEGIRLTVFAEDESFIDALAVAARDTLAILDPDRQPDRVLLFERYARLGLQHLKRACYGDPRPEFPVEGLLILLDELSRPVGGVLPGLESVF